MKNGWILLTGSIVCSVMCFLLCTGLDSWSSDLFFPGLGAIGGFLAPPIVYFGNRIK